MDIVPFVHPIQLRWRDLDALGHVNNATLVTYLEVARWELWRQRLGGPGTADIPFVVARVEIDYRRQVTATDQVRVAVWVEDVGGASFTLAYRVTAGEHLAATARTVQVLVRPNGRPTRVPLELRQRLAALQSSSLQSSFGRR